jgi:hypothetical protein
MNIIKQSLVSAALAVAFSGAAQAITIDPDGAGAMGSINVDVLDWTVGNALITPVDGNVQDPSVGDILQTYAHARLATFNYGGQPVGGLFGNSEWTYVTGFREVVSDVSGTPGTGSATFQTINGGNNFFQIWYSNTAGTLSNNLTGLNFNNATLVLSANVLAWDATDPSNLGQTSFTANTPIDPVTGALQLVPLDAYNVDNYPNILSITGQGGGRIGLDILFLNPLFFPGGLPDIITMDFDTQINLNYDKTDPSACFWDGSAYIDGAGGQGTDCVNSVGEINGLTGPNSVFMTDSSTNLQVPEPMSLALMGLGLAGMGFVGRRRKA